MVMGYMIDKRILFILGIPVYIIIAGIILLVRKIKHVKVSVSKELLKFSFVLYVVALIGVTLFPIEITLKGGPKHNFGAGINYVPFRAIVKDVTRMGHDHFSIGFQIKLLLENVGGNFILLMPLAFMLPVLWKKTDSLKKVAVICFIVSLSIELLQFVECLLNLAIVRIVDIDDLILNTLGAVVGYFVYTLISRFTGSCHTISNDNL